MPKLSIVVPVYNSEKYIKECIDSILTQDYKDFELILVDDGSKDKSPKICEEYAKKDKRVSVYHVENGGAYNARLFGIEKSHGDYLGFIDSDDYIDKNMYSVLMKDAQNFDADMVCCSYRVDIEGYAGNDFKFYDDGIYKCEELSDLKNAMFYNPKTNTASISPSVCIKVFKRTLFSGIQRIDDMRIHISEDGIMSYTAALKADCIVMKTSFRPYHYRENLESTIHNFKPEIFSQVHYVMDYFSELLDREEYRKYKEKFGYYIIDLYMTAVKGLAPRVATLKGSKEVKKNIGDTKALKHALSANKTLSKSDRLRVFLISRKLFAIYFALKNLRKAI